MQYRLPDIADAVIAGQHLSRETALELINLTGQDRFDLFAAANRVRHHFLGREIRICSIASVRTAQCPEDCRFCAQSARYQTNTQPHLAEPGDLRQAAHDAAQRGARSFGFVTSGRGPTDREIDRLAAVLQETAAGPLQCCASLGCLTLDQARRLRTLGVRRYNHNLETSRRFFPSIVTTHSYEDRLATLNNARAAGLELCCGGILNLGESLEDRVDLALELRKLAPETVTINFLNPIPGTPLADRPPLPPLEALQAVATFRLLLPTAHIKVAGGRESCLRDLQAWIFFAGASGFILGNYLTTQGRNPDQDLQLLHDLDLLPS